MTLEGAAEEIRRILSAEGFEDVSVMVDNKVAAYGGVKPDLLLRILRKMKGV